MMEKEDKDVILLVEDVFEVRKFLKENLSVVYNVFEAIDGREGIAKAKEILPDMIISATMIPVVDGYALCRELRENNDTNCIPIILVGSEYWQGLTDWLKSKVLKTNRITKADLDIFKVVDKPADVVTAIKKFYAKS